MDALLDEALVQRDEAAMADALRLLALAREARLLALLCARTRSALYAMRADMLVAAHHRDGGDDHPTIGQTPSDGPAANVSTSNVGWHRLVVDAFSFAHPAADDSGVHTPKGRPKRPSQRTTKAAPVCNDRPWRVPAPS